MGNNQYCSLLHMNVIQMWSWALLGWDPLKVLILFLYENKNHLSPDIVSIEQKSHSCTSIALEDGNNSNYQLVIQVFCQGLFKAPLLKVEDENHSKYPCGFLLRIKLTQGQMQFVVTMHLMTSVEPAEGGRCFTNVHQWDYFNAILEVAIEGTEWYLMKGDFP